MPLRYIIALALSCVLVIAGFAISKYLRHSFVEQFRQDLRGAVAVGKLPKEFEGVDLDTTTPYGFEIIVRDGQENKLLVADLISNLWFVWIPVVWAGCFGTAYLLGRSVGR